MKLNSKKGAALVSVMFFVVILYGIAGMFVLTVVHEKRLAEKDSASAAAFYAAQAAAQAGVGQVDVLINDYLMNTIAQANPSGVVSFANQKVNQGDGIGWLVFAVRDNNTAVLLEDGDEALYSDTGTLDTGTYQYDIVMTEKDDPADAGIDAWDFPYAYAVTGTATADGITASVTIYGDFTVRLQRDNFAKFALFTNNQTTPGGANVWFTDNTNFAGPVHTNSRFNFAFNPSGTFEDYISQHEQYARFYNNGWSVLLDADANGTTDVPVFNSSFNRDMAEVTFSASSVEQDMIDQASAGNAYGSDGIYVPNDGSSLTGGIFAVGDSDITMSVDASNNPVYTISQSGNTTTVTVDKTNNQTTVLDSGVGSPVTYSGVPDGVDDAGTLIYVQGSISNFSGTVQSAEQVTVSSRDDIIINDNILYQDYTDAAGTPGDPGYVPPTAEDTDNLLGIVAWQGNVRIGTSAPNNVSVHGTILASSGVFTVDDYTSTGIGPRGTATLLGGVISDNYGAFGLFNGATGAQVSGYGRNFVYDSRMNAGTAPPYFPSLNTFVAFSNDITDKMVWLHGE